MKGCVGVSEQRCKRFCDIKAWLQVGAASHQRWLPPGESDEDLLCLDVYGNVLCSRLLVLIGGNEGNPVTLRSLSNSTHAALV